MYSSTVIDAMYINKHYPIKGLIGKGKDPILNIQSNIYLVQEAVYVKKDKSIIDDGTGQYFSLQIYQSLAKDTYDTKVKQLQQMMTERFSNYNARVVLLGKQKLSRGCSDLYVLYEYSQNWKPLLKETFDEESAKELLAHLAFNLTLSARFTNEFLDISPHNIIVNKGDGSSREHYQKYVVQNFGLTMGKFDRQYIPSTDPFNKQKTLTNINNAYAFKAGLVVLQVITQLDPKLFFFEDGQFRDKFAHQVLKLLLKPKEGEEELADQLITAFLKANHIPFNKDEKIIKAIYSKKFIENLQRLLSNDPSKRSFFQLLVSSPENYLEVPYPVCNGIQADKTPYFGQGTLNEDKTITPNGVGQGVIKVNEMPQNYYGLYKDGKPLNIGCTEIKEDGFLQLYLFDDGTKLIEFKKLSIPDKSIRYQPAGYIYYGKFNPKNYFPQGDGRMIIIQPDDINLPNKYIAYYYEGSFDENGFKLEGREFYKNRNYFKGKFLLNMPNKGKMVYGEKDHKFEGDFTNYERIKGILQLGQQEFEGLFKNDQIYEGSLDYPDKGLFTGTFKNGQREFGTYKFPFDKITYNGQFKNDKMDGKGYLKLADDLKNADDPETIDVVYEKGSCKTVLPLNYQAAFKHMYEEIKKSKQPQIVLKKNADKQQDDKEEEIQEVIEPDVGEDPDEEKYPMDDQDDEQQDDDQQDNEEQ